MTEVVDYVYHKYVRDRETGKKRTRMYAYGTSMGACTLGLHLANQGHDARLDGACLYSGIYDMKGGYDFFFKNCFGLYSMAIGNFLN